jgi:anaerobic ribonucleoside-triphosphate reductase
MATKPPVVNSIQLEQAVLCTDCEIISDSPHQSCPVCGSRALMGLARILGRLQPELQPSLAQDEGAPTSVA